MKERGEIQKQWEDAMTAMAKRDEAFQSVNEQKEKARTQLIDSSSNIRVLKLEKEEAEKRLQKSELGDCQILVTFPTFRRNSHNSRQSSAGKPGSVP